MKKTRSLRSRALGMVGALLISSSACQPVLQGAQLNAGTPGTPSHTTASPSATRPAAPPLDLHGTGIEVWHPWYGPEASLIDSQIAEFNRDNEWGITVRARGHTSFTELYDSVTAALQAKEAPQVAIAMPEHAVAWDAEGYVADLTTYVADPSYGLTDEETHDFPEVFWNQDVIDGRQLGVPAERSAHLLLYNQSWARDLGFDQPPGTPQQFREQACAAHTALSQDADAANDARGGWLVRTDGTTFLSWITAFDGSVLDGAGYRFLSPRNLEATVYLKQLYDDGCAWVAPANDDPSADFAARQALFGTAPLEELPAIGRAMASAENTDDWTVVGFPGTKQTTLQVYGASFVVLKSTPAEQLAAWLFLRWILDPEQQEKWVEVTGLFPLRTSMESAVNTYARSHPQWATAVKLIPNGSGQPQLASWRQVRIMMGDGFDAMFRTNTPAGRVAEILAIMDRTARDLSP